MAAKTTDDQSVETQKMLYDESRHKFYKRERFLGKGGFAKCYQIVDIATNDVFACKIISKNLIIKQDPRKRTMQEMAIHRRLNHPNIVRFLSHFEDAQNIYIVLELCKNRSLMELHKRRGIVTEYECRYYMYQIIQGVNYLHNQRIIHRDLKLHNIFLDNSLHIKIGDFGLATYVESNGKLRMTLCGTPNYIAPEILTKKGHSFEVDIWSIGCIMYTLLVGQPPFQTRTIKGTYRKIQNCEYHVPSFLRTSAADMIVAMLQLNPRHRPSTKDLLKFEFLTSSKCPECLPISCLTSVPRIESINTMKVGETKRRPLVEKNACVEPMLFKKYLKDSVPASTQASPLSENFHIDVKNLHNQLTDLISSNPKLLPQNLGTENTDPEATPLFWISKWVDYSEKYGFGYQLSDESLGVIFNDRTTLISLPNQINIHYIDNDGKETYMTSTAYCKTLEKKVKLLGNFRRYMSETLAKSGPNNMLENDEISRMPHLHSWLHTSCAVVMHLTNGSIQFNFTDHTKIILCPRMKALTYMNHHVSFRTYRFSTIAQYGCFKDIYEKVRYAHEKIGQMLEKMV